MESFDPQWGPTIDLIRYAKNILIFSGAGLSTESGIPDFRSPNGLWSRFDPSIYANYHQFLKDPKFYWELEKETIPIFTKAKPNIAHKAFVELEKKSKLKAIITQNIDNLHQLAGSKVPIIEIHGNASRAQCLDCESEIRRGFILKQLKNGQDVPECPYCGGRIKTGVILFNEPMGDQVINEAIAYTKNCDLMFVIGTSLWVYPANLIPLIARKNGAKLIFINRDPTPYDKYATVRMLGNVTDILPKLINDV